MELAIWIEGGLTFGFARRMRYNQFAMQFIDRIFIFSISLTGGQRSILQRYLPAEYIT